MIRVKLKIQEKLPANDWLMAEYKNHAGVKNERLINTLAKADMGHFVKNLSKQLEGDMILVI